MSHTEKLNQAEHIAITKYDLYYESRMTKMETVTEQIVVELRDIKNKIDIDMKEIRNSMDKDTREIRSDIRWLLGLMIGFSGVLLGLMAKGFHWF